MLQYMYNVRNTWHEWKKYLFCLCLALFLIVSYHQTLIIENIIFRKIGLQSKNNEVLAKTLGFHDISYTFALTTFVSIWNWKRHAKASVT